MDLKLPRRAFLQMAMAGAAAVAAPALRATAAGNDAVTIGWPNDIPS